MNGARLALVALVLSSAPLYAGCGTADGAKGTAAVERAPVEVFSWGGLQEDLVREHERRYPQDDVIHANAQLSDTARKLLRKRLLEGDPPDSFQVNAGFDLMQWVLVNQIDARASRLLPIDDLPGVADWSAIWPAPLRAALSYDGRPYAVPANVHRINEVFFNPGVLRDVGAQLPERVEELFALGDALARRGIPLFAIGSKDPWTLSILIIESLSIAEHGPDFYESYFSGRLDADDPRMHQTLATALRLLEYANPDRESLHWEQAARMVFDGRAAMTVMGDWARSLFDAPGVDVDARYREATFPGTQSVFVFACNAFPLPVGAKNEAGARRLLESISSLEAQVAIGRSRTAIPARLDLDVSTTDALQASKQRLWRSGRLVLAQSGMVPPSFANDLKEALAVMDREHRISPVVHTLRARHMLLRR